MTNNSRQRAMRGRRMATEGTPLACVHAGRICVPGLEENSRFSASDPS